LHSLVCKSNTLSSRLLGWVVFVRERVKTHFVRKSKNTIKIQEKVVLKVVTHLSQKVKKIVTPFHNIDK